MLDALMGPGRDLATGDRPNDEFKDKGCCKHYLVGCCPNAMLGKKMEAIRQSPATFCICPGVVFERASILNPEGCTKLHSQGLRTQLAEHPDHAKYRSQYEEDLRKFLNEVIMEADGKAGHEKRKQEALGNAPDNERLCEVCGLKYRLKRMEYGIEVTDQHPETDVHKVYVKLRAKLEELKEKHKEEEAKLDEEIKEKHAEKAKLDEEKEAAKKNKEDEVPEKKESSEKTEKSGEERRRSRSKERGAEKTEKSGKGRSRDRGAEKSDKAGREGAEKSDKAGEERRRSRSRERAVGRRGGGDRNERRRSDSRRPNRSRDDRGDRRNGGRGHRSSSRDHGRGDRGRGRDDNYRSDRQSDRRR